MPASAVDIVNAAIYDDYEPTPEEMALVAAMLSLDEEKWKARHGMLKLEGYELRPRLRPGWKPSWLESGADPMECEDGEILPPRPMLVDATHEATGKTVYIKEVATDSEELQIVHLLMQESVNDPQNHCVPVTKVFEDHQNPMVSYIVMPFLRPMDSPPFGYVKEIIEFVDQILEGLVFLHEKGVAHRDCARKNLMMDADVMYPEGFHPIKLNHKPDRSDYAKHASRSTAAVKYYFIDFGISVYIPKNLQPKLVTGSLGRDRDPPELSAHDPNDPSNVVPYDPFKLDIFIIGNMFKREFYTPFSNVYFFEPLIQDMTNVEPSLRPSAQQALTQWQEIRKSISVINREWRPRPREEHPLGAVVLDAVSLHQFFMFCTKSLVERLRL